jgi:hypothetical protein
MLGRYDGFAISSQQLPLLRKLNLQNTDVLTGLWNCSSSQPGAS